MTCTGTNKQNPNTTQTKYTCNNPIYTKHTQENTKVETVENHGIKW